MTKFENRTTIAHVVIVDTEKMEMREETHTVAYTRTPEKAAKAIAATLGIDATNIVVKSLEQSEWKTVELSAGQIVNISEQHNLLEPINAGEGKTCVPYTAYEYSGYAFGYWNDEKKGLTPGGVELCLFSLEKLSKNSARGMLHEEGKCHFDQLYTVDYKQRKEVKRYAIVDSAEYQALRREGAKKDEK